MQSTSQSSQSFTSRAERLRTKVASQRALFEEQSRLEAMKGRSKEEFWKMCVKSRQDVELYYKLYHPQYSEEVRKALALFMEQLVTTKQTDRSDDQLKCLQKLLKKKGEKIADVGWDINKEVEEEKLKGLIAIQEKRIQKLLEDEEAEKQ